MDMKVYRAMAYGFDNTGFIIAATSYDEAVSIARNAGMGSVDCDDVWELNDLQTTQTESGVIEQF